MTVVVFADRVRSAAALRRLNDAVCHAPARLLEDECDSASQHIQPEESRNDPELLQASSRTHPGPYRAKQRQTPVTSARHKMQIVFAIISFEIFRHECKDTKPHPLRAAKDGPPRFPILLRGEYNQWYHRRAIFERRKTSRKDEPPAKSVVQKAYDAAGNLVHVDPKLP
jgi:hypothetical protein